MNSEPPLLPLEEVFHDGLGAIKVIWLDGKLGRRDEIAVDTIKRCNQLRQESWLQGILRKLLHRK